MTPPATDTELFVSTTRAFLDRHATLASAACTARGGSFRRSDVVEAGRRARLGRPAGTRRTWRWQCFRQRATRLGGHRRADWAHSGARTAAPGERRCWPGWWMPTTTTTTRTPFGHWPRGSWWQRRAVRRAPRANFRPHRPHSPRPPPPGRIPSRRRQGPGRGGRGSRLAPRHRARRRRPAPVMVRAEAVRGVTVLPERFARPCEALR